MKLARTVAASSLLAIGIVASPARAQSSPSSLGSSPSSLGSSPSSPEAKPDPLLAVAVGAVIELACFAVGTGMLGQSSADRGLARAGWLTIESGFVAAPIAAHGVVGEWGRGAVFGIVPVGAFVTTSAFFADSPDIIDHGTLNEQRVLWGLFGLALASSGIGIADAALAGRRAKSRAWHVVPSVTPQSASLLFGGAL